MRDANMARTWLFWAVGVWAVAAVLGIIVIIFAAAFLGKFMQQLRDARHAKMSLRGRLWVAPVAAAVAAAGALIYIVDPSKAWWMPTCLFHQLTGLYCPGCGTGRALHKLAHGNFVAAWRLNPLMIVAIPVLIYLIAKSSAPTRPGKEYDPLPNWLPWTIIGVILVFWVVRNIPTYPFTLLAPH